MSEINQKQLGEVYTFLHSEARRKTLLLFNENSNFTFTELYNKHNSKSSSHVNYYLKRLVGAGLLKIDKRQYLLTRIGLQAILLIKNFEKICTSYDLSDCDADGKIKFIVERK